MMAWFQRSDNGTRFGRSDVPDEAFPICMLGDASDEEIEAAFTAWAKFAPLELQWQVANIVNSNHPE